LFDGYGVSRVESLDEMADTLALFAAGRRAGPGALASVHDSGGERALMVDAAASVGVPLAEISEATSKRMEALLDPGLPPVNPLDFWGTGRDSHQIITGCVRALLEDPAVAGLAFSVDLTSEDYPEMGYIAMARETFPDTGKPFAMLSNFSSGIDRTDAKLLDGDGIPVLEGTLTGLAAFKHLFAYRDFRARSPVTGGSPVPEEDRQHWVARLSSGEPIGELEGLALLADYGVPVVDGARADTLEDVIAVAERIGFPIALKTAVPGVQHKSDVGGVRLGIDDSSSLEDAYSDLERSLGPQVTVAPMVPHGVEVALGIVRDPQFGPLVLVGAGGVLVEVLKDRRLAMPPVDEMRARSMVDRLEVRPLLDGVRSQPSADVDALARAIAALSWLAGDLGEHLEALDANPVICGPDGCIAVDTLVIPRR
jgi:acyl-CoA synthetase (NDP forming)